MKPIQRKKRKGRVLLAATGLGLLAAAACGGTGEATVHGVVPACQVNDAGTCVDAGAPDGGGVIPDGG